MAILYIHVERGFDMCYEKHTEMVYVSSLKANPGKYQFMILLDKTC